MTGADRLRKYAVELHERARIVASPAEEKSYPPGKERETGGRCSSGWSLGMNIHFSQHMPLLLFTSWWPWYLPAKLPVKDGEDE